jgi:hypothetical protein
MRVLLPGESPNETGSQGIDVARGGVQQQPFSPTMGSMATEEEGRRRDDASVEAQNARHSPQLVDEVTMPRLAWASEGVSREIARGNPNS